MTKKLTEENHQPENGDWKRVKRGELTKSEYYYTTMRSIESFFELLRFWINDVDESEEQPIVDLTNHLYTIMNRHHLQTRDFLDDEENEKSQ